MTENDTVAQDAITTSLTAWFSAIQMPQIDFAHYGSRLLLDAFIPLAVIAVVYVALRSLFEQMMKLRVTGKANEWVLILNNGNLKMAGVGLSCFRGPFDQVAKFPSAVNRVKFSTEQVTKEMQGVQVEGMLVWSIMRTEDGPFRAFRNLGEDLTTGDPRTANDSLTSMASAIVRSAIANSTISQMLREREELRVQIRKNMADVVQGWGVWLETVEITDVQIKSGSLFKDMQAPYRE